MVIYSREIAPERNCFGMLELKNIHKVYPAGSGTVHALRGIDLCFRENEFVSVLGPSGCGKTTLLNLVGGLDHYTEGDLVIRGRSTKSFKDRDWDTYRNHSVGFVFQSYNLIPHQTVLQNVELALTLSGVRKSERRARAKAALEQVGLHDQLRKKPMQLSGGQMQRVAIARALVNDPDIILADEPTGALDTETSVQVMELLKEVAKERLVIMVTHNPELAEQYSTRIIRMLDGVVISDSAPLSEEEIAAAHAEDAARNEARKQKKRREKKPSMSFFTSFGLSLKNLFTKKGRTILTSFAGSIGIIGIALIYAVSNGVSVWIDSVQEDTLSSYPLTLQATHMDMNSLISAFMGAAESAEKHENDAIYTKSMVYDLINALSNLETSENDLASFKTYLEKELADTKEENVLKEAVSGVQYAYDLDLLIYTKAVDGTVLQSDASLLMKELILEHMGMDVPMMSDTSTGEMASMFSPGSFNIAMWQEMLPGENGDPVSDVLKKQYEMVYGTWPTAYNEIVLVVDENNELDDITLYALGLRSEEDMDAVMSAAVNKTEVSVEQKKWSYEEVCAREYRTVLSADCFVKDEKSGFYTDLRETDTGLKYVYDKGEVLKVTGIIRPNEESVSAMLTGSIGYTHLLTEHVIKQAEQSAAVKEQREKPETDIFTGLPFRSAKGDLSDQEKEAEFRKHLKTLDEAGKAEVYVSIMSIPSAEQMETSVKQAMQGKTREDIEQVMSGALTQQMSVDESRVAEYLAAMSEEELNKLFAEMVEQQVRQQYAASVQAQLAALPSAAKAQALDAAAPRYTTAQCAQYHDEVLEFSESTWEENLVTLGCADLNDPAAIHLYASSFENKDVIEEAIAAYNEGKDELEQIKYTDVVGIMMSSITTILNAITYVLIAFVGISLVVSSIMIGVITLISVQERTKEIGILRAIGASKRNVSGMFNAETVIIGFTSGVLGVAVTYLLCFPINAIVRYFSGVVGLEAALPPVVAVVLVAISVLLTLVAGIIPSRSAAKKDPVVALRTE